jgi:SAM-dependent methyltransferase
MFSIEFLHEIRRHEIAFVERHLPKGVRILEIGGGTGFQAKLLSEHGYDVASIDIPQSNYAEERVFPVLDYDGASVPFPDDSFDVVFSSNLLEHVRDRRRLYAEIGRVLKPGGFCLHAMPSGVWSFWTIVSHYLSTGQRLIQGRTATPRAPTDHSGANPAEGAAPSLRTRITGVKRAARTAIGRMLGLGIRIFQAVRALTPPRHGETGNAFTEIATFSRFWWLRHFRRHGYEILSAEPMGLFYTGYMLRGANWPLSARQRCARWLGSSCILYKLQLGRGDVTPLRSDQADPAAETRAPA